VNKPHLEKARAAATSVFEVVVKARAKFDELTARHIEARSALARAEEAVRQASNNLVNLGEEDGTEAFHAATRFLAEMEARCKAFSETVIPSATAACARAEAAHSAARDSLRWFEVREIVETKVIPGFKKWIHLAEELEQAAQEIEADISKARANLSMQENSQRHVLDGPYNLLACVPTSLFNRFLSAGGVVRPRDVIQNITAVFQLDEGDK
jgi:hypothetical protein